MSKHGMQINAILAMVLATAFLVSTPLVAAAQSASADRAPGTTQVAGDVATGLQGSTASSEDDAGTYAARQAAAPGLEEFAGGDHEVVYVGGSAAVLCIILLIILL